MLAELGPVRRNGRLEIHHAAIGHLVEQGGHDPFAGGHAQREGFRLEGVAVTVARAASEVSNELSAVVHGDRGSARAV